MSRRGISTLTKAPPRSLDAFLALRTAAPADLCLWLQVCKPHYHLQGRPSWICPVYFSSLIAHRSLLSPGSPGSRHTWDSPILTSVPLYLHTVLSALIASSSGSLHKIVFPLRIRCSVPSLVKTLLLLEADLALFSYVSVAFEDWDHLCPLVSSTHSTVCVQKALA